MLEQFFSRTGTVHRLRCNLLGPYLDSFSESLLELGYKPTTVRTRLVLLGSFGRWLLGNEIAVPALNEQILDIFLDERRAQGRLHRGLASIIHNLLGYLRDEGVIPHPEPVSEESPLAGLEHRYENYLKAERGLVQATWDGYRPFIHRFLVERFGDGSLLLKELKPADVSSFVLCYAKGMSPGRAKLMVTALRSFFRFLLQHGEIETDLAVSVLTVRSWRLSGIPKYLTPEEVKGLLAACDRNTSTGRRNYAVLLLLARLGLRAGEVVALKLDDINWRAGKLMIRGKGLSHDWLPLLPDVGEALADYLRKDRPKSPTRRLFVRMKAPHRGLAGPSTVSTIVRRSLERAGLDPPIKGAHLLRHSLATGMLHNGASLSEIAEILRHRVISTTEIYAKVDLDGLQSLAQPWPGIGSVR